MREAQKYSTHVKGIVKNDLLAELCRTEEDVYFPNALTDGVPKGCQMGFCHFWHCLTLGISPHARRARV
jgi:hypothetical protein